MTQGIHWKIAIGASLLAAGSAGAQAAIISGGTFSEGAKEKLVVATPDQIYDPDFVAGPGRFTGVGGLIINTDAQDAAGFVGICSGALIAANIVMTAAHCVDDDDINRIRFRTGPGILAPTAQYEADGYLIHHSYGGLGDDDIAFVRLDMNVSNGEEIYDIYRDRDEIGQRHTKVGLGTTGNGARGTNFALTDFLKRFGDNIYEATGDQIFFGVNDNVLLFDFDSGLDENDVFGYLFRNFGEFSEQTGVRDPVTGELVEVNSSPGDSGGPTFIDGLIAGITSFGITGAIFDGACGPGQLDPDGELVDGPDIEINDPELGLALCTNSSFGELSGDTRVSGYTAFIDRLLRGEVGFNAIPEPGVIGLFGLAVGGLAWRRRRRQA